MKRFSTAVFGGYRKADVDEYIEELVDQLNEAYDSSSQSEEAKKALEQQLCELKEENAKLKEAAETAEGKFNALLEEKNKLLLLEQKKNAAQEYRCSSSTQTLRKMLHSFEEMNSNFTRNCTDAVKQISSMISTLQFMSDPENSSAEDDSMDDYSITEIKNRRLR